jgi:hypothetical protein
LYRAIVTAAGLVVIDVRRSAAFVADNRMIVGATRLNPNAWTELRPSFIPASEIYAVIGANQGAVGCRCARAAIFNSNHRRSLAQFVGQPTTSAYGTESARRASRSPPVDAQQLDRTRTKRASARFESPALAAQRSMAARTVIRAGMIAVAVTFRETTWPM